MKTGIAHLPLHNGKAPRWLFERMVRLAREVTRAVVEEFGPEEMLRRLSNPYWFQAFGCVLAFDWHSSGVTTTVCGALKEGLRGLERDLGLFVCGGKGAASRRTPSELESWGERLAVDPSGYVYASKMSAKVDNTAVQDGYQLESEAARQQTAVLAQQDPSETVEELQRIIELSLPAHHPVAGQTFQWKRLETSLVKAHEAHPADFEALLRIEGVGPKTVRALCLLSEVVYGAAPSFQDPVRYSFAHGGKDGHPFPVDRATYEDSIRMLHDAVTRAQLDRSERLAAFRRMASWLA